MAAGVKKVQAALYLGEYHNGEGGTWRKTKPGRKLVTKVPVTQIVDPVLNQVYRLKVTAKRGSRGPLQRVVTFQLC
jgi:hypothetical protein